MQASAASSNLWQSDHVTVANQAMDVVRGYYTPEIFTTLYLLTG